jgi:hypothetical protein
MLISNGGSHMNDQPNPLATPEIVETLDALVEVLRAGTRDPTDEGLSNAAELSNASGNACLTERN